LQDEEIKACFHLKDLHVGGRERERERERKMRLFIIKLKITSITHSYKAVYISHELPFFSYISFVKRKERKKKKT